jgi:hypothetical protein
MLGDDKVKQHSFAEQRAKENYILARASAIKVRGPPVAKSSTLCWPCKPGGHARTATSHGRPNCRGSVKGPKMKPLNAQSRSKSCATGITCWLRPNGCRRISEVNEHGKSAWLSSLHTRLQLLVASLERLAPVGRLAAPRRGVSPGGALYTLATARACKRCGAPDTNSRAVLCSCETGFEVAIKTEPGEAASNCKPGVRLHFVKCRGCRRCSCTRHRHLMQV